MGPADVAQWSLLPIQCGNGRSHTWMAHWGTTLVTVARLPCMTQAPPQRDSAFTVHGCCVFVNSCAAAACASASLSAPRQHLEQAADAAVRPHEARRPRDALVARVCHHHCAQPAARGRVSSSGCLWLTGRLPGQASCYTRLIWGERRQVQHTPLQGGHQSAGNRSSNAAGHQPVVQLLRRRQVQPAHSARVFAVHAEPDVSMPSGIQPTLRPCHGQPNHGQQTRRYPHNSMCREVARLYSTPDIQSALSIQLDTMPPCDSWFAGSKTTKRRNSS
jgi:hypothetical protein